MKSAAQQAHKVDMHSGPVRKSEEYQEAIVVDGITHLHIEDGAFKLFKCTFPGFNL